jgi:hypothetical protein
MRTYITLLGIIFVFILPGLSYAQSPLALSVIPSSYHIIKGSSSIVQFDVAAPVGDTITNTIHATWTESASGSSSPPASFTKQESYTNVLFTWTTPSNTIATVAFLVKNLVTSSIPIPSNGIWSIDLGTLYSGDHLGIEITLKGV